MVKDKIDIYKMKLGEVINHNMMNGILESPIKCVAFAVTLQDKNGVQMESQLKHKDFIEDNEEEEEEEEDEFLY